MLSLSSGSTGLGLPYPRTRPSISLNMIGGPTVLTRHGRTGLWEGRPLDRFVRPFFGSSIVVCAVEVCPMDPNACICFCLVQGMSKISSSLNLGRDATGTPSRTTGWQYDAHISNTSTDKGLSVFNSHTIDSLRNYQSRSMVVARGTRGNCSRD